jgi:hypothetical protein
LSEASGIALLKMFHGADAYDDRPYRSGFGGFG